MWWFSQMILNQRIQRNTTALFLGFILLLVSACGFQPLYGTKSTRDRSLADLNSVAIDPIPDRIGQLVRNNLIDRMHTQGRNQTPRYRLKISLNLESEGLAVRSDDVVTRRNLVLTADYKIMNSNGDKELFTGRTFSIASYNVVGSDYANLSARRDAHVRTAREVSEEIKNQVVYFVRINAAK